MDQASREPAFSGSRLTPGPPVFLRLVRECLEQPFSVAGICAALLALGGARLYLTWLLKLGEDPVARGDAATVNGLFKSGAVAAVVLIAAMFVARYLLSWVSQTLVQRLRDAAQRRVVRMPLTIVRALPSGEVLSRLFNDAGMLAGFVQDIVKRLIGETFILVGALAMMFYLEWRLALVTCVVVPAAALLLARLGKVIRRRGAAAQHELGALSSVLTEQILGLATIKGFQAEEFEVDRFAEQDARYRHEMLRSERWAALLVTSVSIVAATGLFGIIWYGSRSVIAGRSTPGALLVFSLYAVQTIVPLRRLSDVHALLQRTLAAAARVYEIIDFEPVEDVVAGAPTPPARGAVRFEGVSFGYVADRAVLDDVTLVIERGESLALVAASGGGKTTVGNLLLRHLEPRAGRILLDGRDLRTLPLVELRRAICVVEQEPSVFRGSLRDNVRYGSWSAPPAEIERAAILAGLEPLVRSLPRGLESAVSERGHDLSGGQKQRIALARAIVRDPAVLVLDEATSALDSDTEASIFASLQDWLVRRTVLVMAHRLSTISRFDRIVVLADGRVVGDGTLSALLRSCPIFTQLFAEQLAVLDEGRERPARRVG